MNRKIKTLTSVTTAGVIGISMGAPLLTQAMAADNLNVVITKTRYIKGDGDAPTIDNKGKVYKNQLSKTQADDQGIILWDKDKYGDVEFIYHAITKEQLEAANIEGLGEIKKAPGNQAYYTLTNEQVTKIRDYMKEHPYETDKANSLLKDAKPSHKVAVDDNGQVTYNIPKTVDGEGNEVVAILIEEAKTPTAFVSEKAAPIVLPVPMTNAEGTGRLTNIHLYPKNGTQERKIKLIKKTDNGALLPGAKFQLYKGEPGQGTLLQDNLETSRDKSEIVIEGVTKGKYYLVEIDSDVVAVDSEHATPGTPLVDWTARNDANNKLVFEVTDTTVFDNGFLNAEYVNYKSPTLTKELVTQPESVAINAKLDFKGTIGIPENIEGSVVTVAGQSQTVNPYNKIEFRDTASANLSFLKNVEPKVVVGADELVLTKDDDYTVSYEGENKMKVALTGAGIQKLYPHKGKKLFVEYSMTVKDTVNPATKETNKASLTYSNDPTNTVERTYDGDEIKTDIQVFGAKFKKTDNGVFNTGLLNQGLQGAKFVLKNNADEFIVGKEAEGRGFKRLQSDTDMQEVIREATAGGYLFTSGQDGTFAIKGLPVGEYKLVEVEAPADYQLRADEIEFSIENQEYADVTEINIKNVRKPDLPLTGSEKTVLVTGAGLATVVVGVYVAKRKRGTESLEG